MPPRGWRKAANNLSKHGSVQKKGAMPNLDDMLIRQADSSMFGITNEPGTNRTPYNFKDPLLSEILTLFPQDNEREANRRYRHWYKFHPYVRGAIDFHTETPLSDFDLRSPSIPEAQQYYNDFKIRKNLLHVLISWVHDRHLFGESFMYGNWDEVNAEYASFVQFPPEEIEIHGTYMSDLRGYALRPNKETKKLLHSNNPTDRYVAEHMRQFSPNMVKAVNANQPFPLLGNRLMVLQNTSSMYLNRGIPMLSAAASDLLYEGQLDTYRNAFIQRQSSPLKIYKLGDLAKGWIPDKRMFNEFRNQLQSAESDPAFSIITHPFLSVEYHSGADKILNLIPLYELVQRRLFAALFVSESIISGEKTPYAAGITFMRGLMNRYLTLRNDIEVEVNRVIFTPLARARKYYKPTQAEISHRVRTNREDDSRLVLPKIQWHKANLLSNQAIMQMIINLEQNNKIPFRYVAELFGWNVPEMLDELKREEGTRVDPTFRDIKKKFVENDDDLAMKLLLGDNIDDAIKERFKEKLHEKKDKDREEVKEDKVAKPKKGKGDLAVPELNVKTPPIAEEGKTPPESKEEKGPPKPPEAAEGFRKPKPSEGEAKGETPKP